MFVRVKKTGNYSYTQIVENYREDGKVKQRIIATLGQYEALSESGKLDALARSLLKYTTSVRAVDALRDGSMRARRTLKVGPAIVFERLWRELGIAEVLDQMLEKTHYHFPSSAPSSSRFCTDSSIPGATARPSAGKPTIK